MKEFIKGYYDTLFCETRDWNTIVSEALITFGGKTYPNFGQVVIVAGGAGSGKGFVIDNLFGITGKRYDVDYLKQEVRLNKEIRKMLCEKYNVDDKIFEMSTPEDVSAVHELMKLSGLKQKYEANIFTMAKNAPEDKKPNLIFDKTCSSITDILDITTTCINHGYKPENIHLVWVLNDVETALKQNATRARKVNPMLLQTLHAEVATTMKKFLANYNDWPNKLEGDIWIVFNKQGVDSKVKKLKNGKFSGNENFYIEDANYYKIKNAGDNNILITKAVADKINSYIPA